IRKTCAPLSLRPDVPQGTNEIDRLRWVVSASFLCHGAKIGIRCNQPAIWHQVVDRLPPHSRVVNPCSVAQLYSLWVGTGAKGRTRDHHRVYAGSSIIICTRDLQEALYHLESDLHFAVATGARRLFVHAGVVVW